MFDWAFPMELELCKTYIELVCDKIWFAAHFELGFRSDFKFKSILLKSTRTLNT